MADTNDTAPESTSQAATFAGDKFGYHASNVLEAAEEAFPVVPHVFELHAKLTQEIDQGIADGSIFGTDKDKILELRDKYEDIWEQHAQQSAQWKDQANADHLQRAQDDLTAFVHDHPDVQAELNDAPGPVVVEAVAIQADLAESNIDRATEFTSGFLDSAQIYLDYTRELAELRSHQDGADTEALQQTLQKIDTVQNELDNAYDAAETHHDQKIDAVEAWQDKTNDFVEAVPHFNKTSEGYQIEPRVSVADPGSAAPVYDAATADNAVTDDTVTAHADSDTHSDVIHDSVVAVTDASEETAAPDTSVAPHEEVDVSATSA